MSIDQGRSWRPEKKIAAKQSRKLRVIGLSALVASLSGIVLWLILHPPAPRIHIAVISVGKFDSDPTRFTPPPTGSTAATAIHIKEFADSLAKNVPAEIGSVGAYSTISEFVSTLDPIKKDSLFVYLTCAAWCVPDESTNRKSVVQFLPADPNAEPYSFETMLSAFEKRGSSRTLLILELTGRSSGLGSGVVSEDVPVVLRQQLQASASKVPGLTIVCACGPNERSWEYFADSSPLDAEKTALPGDVAHGDVAVADKNLQRFDGTVFGHFLISALRDGHGESAVTLQTQLASDVKDWVTQHYGESQSVWLASGSRKAASSKFLLVRYHFPDLLESARKNASGADQKKDPDQQTSTADSGDSLALVKDSQSTPDSSPEGRLRVLKQDRDALAGTMAPLLRPADYLRLQSGLTAIERFAMNGNVPEFNRLHDALHREVEMLKSNSQISMSKERQEVQNWLSLPTDDDVLEQFPIWLNELGVEPLKAAPLPKELRLPVSIRRQFSVNLTRHIESFAKKIPDANAAEKKQQLQQCYFLVNNLAEKGWPLDQFTEPMTTIREVLRDSEQDPAALIVSPMSRLIKCRSEALHLASGIGPDGRAVSRATWQAVQIPREVEIVLATLHVVERWLCVGTDAIGLADAGLRKAEHDLELLRKQVSDRELLVQMETLQKTDLPFVIEYLALRQEESIIRDEERSVIAKMAETCTTRNLVLEDFPAGQLSSMGLEREHLAAMLALTRNFSESPVSTSDGEHYERLNEYVRNRADRSDSALEHLQLLALPSVKDRDALQSGLTRLANVPSGIQSDKSSHSGIWMSFWSLRLLEALSPEKQPDGWKAWSRMVAAINDPKALDVRFLRAEMAQWLRKEWIKVVSRLTPSSNGDVFAADQEVLGLLGREVSRRYQSSDNKSLYSSLPDAFGLTFDSASLTTMRVLTPEVEQLPNLTCDISIKLRDVDSLYLRRENISIVKPDVQVEGDWLRIPLRVTEQPAEHSVELTLKTPTAIVSPQILKIVAVDRAGVPFKTEQIRLLPSSQNLWHLEVAEIEEGKAEERIITLPDGNTPSEKRLPLLPSTWDSESKSHLKTRLKLRLVKDKGVSAKVNITIRPFDATQKEWTSFPLEFPAGTNTVDIPLQMPAANPAVTTPATSPPVASEIDVRDGIVFEITPTDLPDPQTSRLVLIPTLLSINQIFETPVPRYNEESHELEVALNLRPVTNSTVLSPSTFPAELILNPEMEAELDSGTRITPSGEGYTFRLQFKESIENTIESKRPEFGVSLGGIPHAWWWDLKGGVPSEVNGARIFLEIENPLEATPVSRTPALLLSTGWQKARLRSSIFLHGNALEEDMQLFVRVVDLERKTPTPITNKPQLVKHRYLEKILVSPGQSGLWMFSTETMPFTATFSPAALSLNNGRYEMVASFSKRNHSLDPLVASTKFTLDDSKPVVEQGAIDVSKSIRVTEPLTGKVTVQDPESGISAIRVGLKESLMESLDFIPGNSEVSARFKLDPSRGFPKLEQLEKDNEDYVDLIVEAKNGAGLKETTTQRVRFVLPGKPAKMAPAPPGSLEVTFSSSAEFDVSVTGPNGITQKKIKQVADRSVTFAQLEPGTYQVRWKPVTGSAGSGSIARNVKSGDSVQVKAN